MDKTDFDKLFGLVQKEFGVDKAFKGDDLSMGSIPKYGISSGLPVLDLYLGAKGGYPAGKVIEFYGFQMCGKTTGALQAAAEWQKRGGTVMFIDTEKSFHPKRAKQVGCDPSNNFIKTEADTIEEIFEQITKTLDLLEKNKVETPFLFIVDSVNGVPTLADEDKELTDNERVGHEAKQIKRGMKKINPRLDKIDCAPSVIFINHAITKIVSFGKKSDSGGGHAIKFYASVRLEFGHLGWIKEKDGRKTGQKIKIKIEKLKGGEVEYEQIKTELTNAYGFDKWEGLAEAMAISGFGERPKGSQVITLLKGTGHETVVKNTQFREWVEQNGGYNNVYLKWRTWCIKKSIISPWGGKHS